MQKLRVHNFCISLDGYAAGPDQRVDQPLGRGGERLHDWLFRSAADGELHAVDQAYRAAGDEGIGATIMGRNMFGPVRGPWPDNSWRGWWGEQPPFGHPVFVLTHHFRPSLEMRGGTAFHFLDVDAAEAVEIAFDAANGKDVRLGGGAATVRRFLLDGLVDELHLVVVPLLLGAGERLFEHGAGADYVVDRPVEGESGVLHVRLTAPGFDGEAAPDD